LRSVLFEGIAFELGVGRKIDYGKAFERYKIAADHGITSAMVWVGLMYKIGQGLFGILEDAWSI
jgi:TPR repeat protein